MVDEFFMKLYFFEIFKAHGQHHIQEDQIVVQIVAQCHHQRIERVINYLPAVVV